MSDMSMYTPVDTLAHFVPEGYCSYKGMFKNIEIRIEGRKPKYPGSCKPHLRVRAYVMGERLTYCSNPFDNTRAANAAARELAESLAGAAARLRKDGFKGNNPVAHVQAYVDHMKAEIERLNVMLRSTL